MRPIQRRAGRTPYAPWRIVNAAARGLAAALALAALGLAVLASGAAMAADAGTESTEARSTAKTSADMVSPPLAGLNLAGGEFGAAPGVYGRDYIYPSPAEFDYAKAKGFAVVRIPFLWERLQPRARGPFDQAEQARLVQVVEEATARGLGVILDLHNYGRREGAIVGSDAAPVEMFTDFWRRMGVVFGGRKGVIFGLMNEPHDQPVDGWARAAEAAVAAIRATGACTPILIPGANWSGAHSWYGPREGVSNAQAMGKIARAGTTLFEFHQYLDPDSSGTGAVCRTPAEAAGALRIATRWLRAHKAQGFLGEFGAPDSPQCLAGLEAMIDHMRANADVWAGWAYWAAGAWWPKTYPLSVQPVDGVDRPQMAALAKAATGVKPLSACQMPGAPEP